MRNYQIFAGHAEASAGYLLDSAAAVVAVGVQLEAGRVFAPFSRVAATADAVHGDGQRFMAASREIEPYDMAPVANRLTITAAGSTSSSGTARSDQRKSNSPRSVSNCAAAHRSTGRTCGIRRGC